MEKPGTLKLTPTHQNANLCQQPGLGGRNRRVNTIGEEYRQRFNLPNDDTKHYACGHPGMIEEVKEKIVPKGWKFAEERFWKP